MMLASFVNHIQIRMELLGGENSLLSLISDGRMCFDAHNGNQCHATSSRNGSYFSFLAHGERQNGTLDQFGVSEEKEGAAQVHFMDVVGQISVISKFST